MDRPETASYSGQHNFSKTANNFNRNRPNTASLRNINEEEEFANEKEKLGGFSRVNC